MATTHIISPVDGKTLYPISPGAPTTHPCISITCELDALAVFEACRKLHLPVFRDGLYPWQMGGVRPGAVFVFERQDEDMGSWSDGLRWSQACAQPPFLKYLEMHSNIRPRLDEGNKNAFGEEEYHNTPCQIHGLASFGDESTQPKPGGMHKWKFCADVVVNPKRPKKRVQWCLVWYTDAKDSVDGFPGVQEDDLLRTIKVPRGVYFSPTGAALPTSGSARVTTYQSPSASRGNHRSRRIHDDFFSLARPEVHNATSTAKSLWDSSSSSSTSSLGMNQILLPPYLELASPALFSQSPPLKGRTALPPLSEVLRLLDTIELADDQKHAHSKRLSNHSFGARKKRLFVVP